MLSETLFGSQIVNTISISISVIKRLYIGSIPFCVGLTLVELRLSVIILILQAWPFLALPIGRSSAQTVLGPALPGSLEKQRQWLDPQWRCGHT